MKKTLTTLFSLGFTTTAMAHEGHGTPGQGNTITHYLLEPAHIPAVVLVVAAVLGGAYFLARFVNRRRATRPVSTQDLA